jgi:hypothetical protein
VRKLIYREIVHYQDTHPGRDEQAYGVIANRYRVSAAVTHRIGLEGATQNWPMPPLPK